MKGKKFSRGLSKILSLLLSFVMIFGALPTIAQAEPGTDTYQRVTSLTDGGVYVICVKPSSSYLAMNNTITNGFAGTTSGLTVIDDGQLLTSAVDASLLWTYSSSGNTMKNGDKYLSRTSSNSSNLQLADSAGDYGQWSLSSNKLSVRGSSGYSTRYLVQSGSVINASTQRSDQGTNFYVFQRVSKSVSGIAIKTPPTKTTYVAGVDSFDPAGMVITATYSDNTTADISTSGSPNGYTYSPTGALPANTTTVAVTYGGKSTSQAVTMNAAPPNITTQPADTSTYVGDTASLTVAATVADGGTRSYQWYSNTSDSNTEGSIISGATGTSYTIPTTTAGTYYYYCVVTNTNNAVNGTKAFTTSTRAATVTVNANPQLPNISGQPSSLSEYVGDAKSLSVTADSPDGGTLSYQWYNNSSNSSTYGGSAISGATGSSYQPSSAAAGTVYYYCAVSNTTVPPKKATLNSNITGVTVNSVLVDSITVRVPPTKTVYNEGEIFDPSGMVIAAQYNNGTTADVTRYSIAPPGVLTPDDHTITITYNGKTATQDITVHTNAKTPSINAGTPVDWLALNVGEAASLSVTATVSKGALTYQWYSNTIAENSGGTPVGVSSDNPSLTLDTTVAGTTFYYCVVTNTDTTATGNKTATAASRVAQVVVRKDAQTPNIGLWSPEDTSFYKNSVSRISVAAWIDWGNLTYQWYKNTTGLNSGGTPVGSSSSSSSLLVDTSTVGTTYYYCVVTNTDTGAPGIQTATATSRAARVDISAFNKGTVLFTFDDGWKDQLTEAYPILHEAGFKATVYVNGEFVEDDDPEFMRLGDLRTLNAAGWDIANHTYDHSDIGDLTDQENMAKLKAIYTDCADWLDRNGLSRASKHVAYPSGLYSSDLIRLLKSSGFKTGRATMFGQQFGVQYENELFKLPVYSLGDDDDLQACISGINTAASSGSTIILMLHRVEQDPGDLVTTKAQLQRVVNEVSANVRANKLSVMTITQWYAAQNQTPAGQTPPAPTVTNDDVANTVSGMNLVMEYKLDDAAGYTKYDPITFGSLNLAGNHTLAVRYAASGADPAGPDKILTFTKTLESLSISKQPEKTTYIEGNTFNAAGMEVTAHYDDKTSEVVTGYTTDPTDALTKSNKKVTVSYTNAGITKTVDQPITVNPKKLSAIAITTDPIKKSYVEGTSFDPEGMIITATYDNGKSETVTGYTIEPSRELETTDMNVTISYTVDGVTMTADQTILVTEKALTGIEITKAPTKTIYIEGNKFDPAGMVVTASYNNGKSEAVTGYTVASDGLAISDTKVVVSYNRKGIVETAEQPITVNAKALESIKITTEPLQKSYIEGNVFNSTGMVVTAFYDNGTQQDVLGYSVDPSGTLEKTDTKVTVSYTFAGMTKTVDQRITVHAKSLARIEITTPPSKTIYVQGESFKTAGMVVTAHYDNDTSAVVTGYSVDPSGALTTSDGKVTVSYTYAGVTKTTDQPITVLATALDRIGITTPPSKTSYIEGNTFDPTDMVVTAYYNNGTSGVITGYIVTPSGELATADTKVTVSYGGKTAEQAITVNAKKLTGIAITAEPTKKAYIEGNTFDPAGMVVTAYYDNGKHEDVTGYSVAPAGQLKTADKKVTISYGGKTADQAITVAAKALDRIAITAAPSKTQYVAGQAFDPTGMDVTAYYNNGTFGPAGGFTWIPAAALATTDTKVTVSFTYEGVTRTADQAIWVIPKTMTGLYFKTHPTSVYYVEGETFNPAGMVLTATYNDGSVIDVHPGQYALSINRPLQMGDTSIEAIYDTMRVAQSITVMLRPRVFTYTSAQLKDIGATAGTLSPMFDPNIKNYTLVLDENTAKTTIMPLLADASSKLTINGRKASSKTFTLANAKKTKVTIKVQPKTGKAITYTVTIMRAPSTNASLALIKASKGSFAKVGSTNYTVNLLSTQTGTKFTLKLADKKAKYTIRLDGKKTSSKSVSLKPGTTRTLVITVTPQAGIAYAITYTVTITRAG